MWMSNKEQVLESISLTLSLDAFRLFPDNLFSLLWVNLEDIIMIFMGPKHFCHDGPLPP